MCTCVSEGTCTRVQCLLRPEGGVRSPGTVSHPEGVLEPHPGPLHEQQEALLTTEPSVQLEENKKNPLNQRNIFKKCSQVLQACIRVKGSRDLNRLLFCELTFYFP